MILSHDPFLIRKKSSRRDIALEAQVNLEFDSVGGGGVAKATPVSRACTQSRCIALGLR